MSKFLKCYGTCIGPLDFPMTDEDARELEKNLETGDYSPFKFQKSDAFEAFLPNERADISVITDPSIDKQGEITDPKSLDFSRFQKNPIVAFNHQYSIPPVGRSLWQKLCAGGVWKAKTQYIERPEKHPVDAEWFPESIFHMVKSGAMNGKSLGGAAKWKEPTQEDADRLGFELKSCNRISEKALVWEYSVCPIGINSNAVVEQISKGLLTTALVKQLMGQYIDEELFKGLEQKQEEIIIKSFTTKNEYLKRKRARFESEKIKLETQIPELVDNTLKRLMGKVS